MPDTVLDRLNKDVLSPRNRNIDSSVAVAVSDGVGASALADHVDDATHVKLRGSTVRDTNKPRHPDTALNEDQHELLTDVKAIFDEVEAAGGVVPATALNMHPWIIAATGPHNSGITIPMCPIQDEYTSFTLRTFRRDFADRGGKFKVTPIWPITILRDFQRQHENWGGIIVYLGDTLPGQAKNKISSLYDKLFAVLDKITDKEAKLLLQETIEEGKKQQTQLVDQRLSDSEIRRLIINANDRRVLWYEQMYRQAEEIAADQKANQRQIQNMHRQIARWMVARGRYAVLPRWVSETKPRDFVEKPCPKCGAAVDLDKNGRPKGFACVKCNYILDGIRAYEAGEPGAEQALKRCLREDLDAAGLKHVVTLAEERAAEAKDSKKKDKDAK